MKGIDQQYTTHLLPLGQYSINHTWGERLASKKLPKLRKQGMKSQNNKSTYNKHNLTKDQAKYNMQKDSIIGSLHSLTCRKKSMQLLYGCFY